MEANSVEANNDDIEAVLTSTLPLLLSALCGENGPDTGRIAAAVSSSTGGGERGTALLPPNNSAMLSPPHELLPFPF